MTEELIKLMLSVAGDDAITSLSDKLKENQRQVEQLTQAFLDGDVTTDDYFRTAKKLASEIAQLQSAIDVLERSVAAADNSVYGFADAAKDATTASMDLGRAAIYVAGSADDAEEAYRQEQAALDDLTDGAKLSAVEMAHLGAAKTGTAGASANLKTSIKALEAELAELRKEARAGNISLEDFRVKANAVGQTLQMQKSTLNALGNEFGINANKVLQFGQSIDDLQYVAEMGLRPIINNVMQFSPAIGVAMIAVDQLYRRWDDIKNLFDQGIPRPVLDQTEELKKKIDEAQKVTEELGKKTRLDLDELTRYKQASEDVKKFNDELKKRDELQRILNQRTEEQQQFGGAFQKAVSASGGQAALDELISAVKGEADSKGNVYNLLTGKVTKAEDYAKDLVREGTAGNKVARDEAASFLAKAYGDKSTFGQNITKFSPEQAERNKAAEVEAQHAAEEARMADKRRQELAAKEAMGLKEAEDLQRREQQKKEQDAKRTLEESRRDNLRKEAERQAEAVRKAAEAERDRLDPVGAAQRRMTQDARSGLRRQGVAGDMADLAAPKLAELVMKGMDVQSATMQALHEAQQQIEMANRALQQNLQMQALIQQQQRRARIMMPTTQPMPFAN